MLFLGIYPIEDYPSNLIDISRVTELKGYTMDQNLIIGAATTLSEMTDIFQKQSNEIYFQYLKQFLDHLQLVAHLPVKNVSVLNNNFIQSFTLIICNC